MFEKGAQTIDIAVTLRQGASVTIGFAWHGTKKWKATLRTVSHEAPHTESRVASGGA